MREENLAMPEQNHTITTVSEKIRAIIKQDEKIQAAYLLGSIVHGNFHPHSDIDLAILPIVPKSYSTMDRLMLASRLKDELDREIDIGILGTYDLIYSSQAILQGECIYYRDRFAKDLFAATCLSLYFDLKRQRIEVERAYQVR